MTRCDILLVGVGGQGVLTLADLVVHSALAAGVPTLHVPTKGMAQRGGFVKVEVRLGAEGVGPRIAARRTDIVVAMERSESLKGIPYAKPGGHVLLYDHVWEPTGVQLGVDAYPSLNDVRRATVASGAKLTLLRPADRPTFDGKPVAANVFLLGALLTIAPVGKLVSLDAARRVLAARWPKAAEANRIALDAGADAARQGQLAVGELLGSSPSGGLLDGGVTE